MMYMCVAYNDAKSIKLVFIPFHYQNSSQKDPVNMSSASDSLGVSKVDPRFAKAVASDGKNIGTSWATQNASATFKVHLKR